MASEDQVGNYGSVRDGIEWRLKEVTQTPVSHSSRFVIEYSFEGVSHEVPVRNPGVRVPDVFFEFDGKPLLIDLRVEYIRWDYESKTARYEASGDAPRPLIHPLWSFECAGFLAAIEAAPDDDLPKLVFCDWLDENEFHQTAEDIRRRVSEPGFQKVPQRIPSDPQWVPFDVNKFVKWLVEQERLQALDPKYDRVQAASASIARTSSALASASENMGIRPHRQL